ERLARPEAAALRGADRRCAGHAERGLLVDRLAQRLEAAILDLLGIDDDRRRVGVVIGPRDARAGHHDVGVVALLRGGRLQASLAGRAFALGDSVAIPRRVVRLGGLRRRRRRESSKSKNGKRSRPQNSGLQATHWIFPL